MANEVHFETVGFNRLKGMKFGYICHEEEQDDFYADWDEPAPVFAAGFIRKVLEVDSARTIDMLRYAVEKRPGFIFNGTFIRWDSIPECQEAVLKHLAGPEFKMITEITGKCALCDEPATCIALDRSNEKYPKVYCRTCAANVTDAGEYREHCPNCGCMTAVN